MGIAGLSAAAVYADVRHNSKCAISMTPAGAYDETNRTVQTNKTVHMVCVCMAAMVTSTQEDASHACDVLQIFHTL